MSAELREMAAEQWALWLGLLGGPAAWTFHLGLSYLLVPHVCDTGRGWLLWLVTLGAITLVAAALLASVRVLRGGRRRSTDPLTDLVDRDLVLGALGIFLSLTFLAVSLLERVPVLFIDPCVMV